MITRFAPSPTGPLHLGHAYSALVAYGRAQDVGGTFLLRIEDIDQSRARARWEMQIYDDLAWLGVHWPTPVMRQSDRIGTYRAALERLWDMGLLYPCNCNRRDVLAAASAPQEGAPLIGPDGVVYPGTCRHKPKPAALPEKSALRLDTARAMDIAGALEFEETGAAFGGIHKPTASDLIRTTGDIVLARRDMGTSYHLAVTLDDAAQEITEVVRGQDLFDATPIHVLLQRLLDMPTPQYHHHALIRDETGKRLAKRDDARAISKYRDDGLSPAQVKALIGF